MRIFSTIAAIGAAALFGGSAYAAGPLGIATSNPGSLYHNIGTAIAKAANCDTRVRSEPDSRCRVPGIWRIAS